MKIFKIVVASAVLGVLTLTFTVFGYEKFSDNANVTASLKAENLGSLAADITATTTDITLQTVHSLTTGLALIGSEIVNITATSSNSATITRAKRHPHASSTATVAAPHSQGAVIRNISQTLELSITPTNALAADDELIVTIPNNSPISFGAMGTLTVVGTTTATTTVDADARTFTTTGLTGASMLTIEITDIEMPQNPGQYALPVEIRSKSGTLLEMGVALVSWANQTSIRVIIQPALIMTLDKTNIDITANPTVNDGENYSKKTVIRVSTNSKDGYQVHTKLQGKQDSNLAQLDSTSTTEVISSQDSIANENAISYVAYNGNGTSTITATAMKQDIDRTRDQIKADASKGMAFATTSQVMKTVTAEESGTDPSVLDIAAGFFSFIQDAIVTVYYLLNVNFEIPSGEYQATVTYTAVPAF